MRHIPNETFKTISGVPATIAYLSKEPEALNMRMAAIIGLSTRSCSGVESAKTLLLIQKLLALAPDVGELLLEEAEFERIEKDCNSPAQPFLAGFIHGQIYNLLKGITKAE